MHTHDARKRGISDQKLALLPAWEEAGELYTEQEQAALALTEESWVRWSRWRLTIDAWNRIGVTTRLPGAEAGRRALLEF